MQITIPADEKLEMMVLSSVMNSINAANECHASLDDSDFYFPKNKILFSLFKGAFREDIAITLPSVLFQLSKENEQDIDSEYIQSIAYNYWAGMPYSVFINDLKNISSLRKSIFAGQELITESSAKDAQIDQVLTDHQNKLLKVQGISRGKVNNAKDLYDNFRDRRNFHQDAQWRMDRYSKGLPVYDGISTGYTMLDDTLGAMQNSCIYYIGARTSMGKTTFMLNLMRNMLSKYSVGVFSLEMSASVLFAKLLCMHCDVPYSDYFKGKLNEEQLQRMMSIEQFAKSWKLFIEDEDAINISKLTARAKRLKQNNKIDILYIDYLTRIQSVTKYPSKHLQVDEVSKGLQSLAKALEIPVVCLAQLNRQVTNREKNRPNLADFRESGSIEEDADACLLIHRPEYYDKNDKPGAVEIMVAKNRLMGTLKTIEFTCNSYASERYHERRDISEEVKEANQAKVDENFKEFTPKTRYSAYADS